ncbi:MAG: DNA topoisomerase VI subunit B [Candidatus Marsarchaeota archaeon]|nr:DNA topoisomerase VI subunit B [Candidatus Marsarchaeota archaeon]
MAGFDNQSRAVYTVVRELVENSLDACDAHGIQPVVYVSVVPVSADELEVTVADNGQGVPPRYIADSFGRVFFGSKYSVKQNRGTFGLGGKMAILYGQLSTGEPVQVVTSTGTDLFKLKLSIDVKRNQPIIHEKVNERNSKSFHGTTISLRFKGDYVSARSRVIKYLRMTRIALPYATLIYSDPDGLVFIAPALTDKLPQPPRETPPHPYGIDIVKLKEMIQASKRDLTVNKFLMKFSKIGPDTAARFSTYMNLNPDMRVRRLDDEDIKRIVEGFRTYRFLPPDGSALSPLEEETIRTGLTTEYKPEFIAATTRPPSAYEGFSFVVEAAIAYGGNVPMPSSGEDVRLLRFANKIPLIYDSSNDVAMHVLLEDIDWHTYKLDPKVDQVLFFVHIAATKVPFKTAGKEYVADREEVRREIKLAFRECSRQLKVYLSRKVHAQHAHQRTEKLSQYLTLLSKYTSVLCGKPQIPNNRLLKLIGSVGGDDEATSLEEDSARIEVAEATFDD